MRYAFEDSICSTIVYKVKKEIEGNMLSHKTPQAFWGNEGFLLFDAGRYISVTADKVTREQKKAEKPDFSLLKQAVSELRRAYATDSAQVQYTGSIGSFCFQGGTGNGWTKGTRYTFKDASVAAFNKLKKTFMSCTESGKAVNLIAYNRSVMLKDEHGKDFFIASFNDRGHLHFLHAEVEDEICIPSGWETTDFFNNGAIPHTDMSPLDSIYEAFAKRPGASATQVRYTGGGSRDCSHFIYQRAWGAGWTRGTRIEADGISREESEHIMSTFLAYKDKMRVVQMEHTAGTYEESTRTFYGYDYDEDGKAFFLKATTEGDICVPADWTTRNHFEGSKPGAIDKADDKTRRLVGLSRLWAGMKQNFVFMDRMPVDWDSLYVEMIPKMDAAKDDEEAVRLMEWMTARAHDGHTYIIRLRSTNTRPVPFTTRLIGGKVYVDGILSSQLLQQGLKRGMELCAIDGTDVRAYAREHIEPYVPASTEQWLNHMAYEGFALTTHRTDTATVFTFRDGERRFDIPCKAGTYDQDLKKEHRYVVFSKLESGIGYLKISGFDNELVRKEFDACYPEVLKSKTLIIDLRGNGGGHSSHADYVLRHLSEDSIRTDSWRSPKYIPAYMSWGYGAMWHEEPSGYMQPVTDKPIYKNPVVVLVDNATFSAAEDFCGVFRGMKRGLLIGQPTGGSTGNGIRIELIPGVAHAWICSKHDIAADGTDFVGKGFTPDIQVEEDYDSFFGNAPDKCLSTAIRVLQGKH